MPNDPEQRRNDIARAVAEHLLRDGFRNSGIRALAASAGLSDRMVMYYFQTKGELIEAALLWLAADLSVGLAEVLAGEHASADDILDALLAATAEPHLEPVIRLWFEVVGHAMRGDEPYRSMAQLILTGWEDWIRNRLGPRRAHQAPAVLARLEGELMVRLLRAEV